MLAVFMARVTVLAMAPMLKRVSRLPCPSPTPKTVRAVLLYLPIEVGSEAKDRGPEADGSAAGRPGCD